MSLPGGVVDQKSQPDDVEMQDKDSATPDSAIPYSTFSTGQTWSIVCLCGPAGFFSPFSAYMYFPALKDIAAELDTPISLIYASITVYLVMQGIVPAFFGDLADQIGRRPVYVVALTIYFAACVALALQTSYAALLVLRILQSAGCSATIALGVIVVADIVPPHQRGTYTGAMLTGPNAGPSIGPIIGGIVTEKIGWRWTFWILAILGAVCLVPFIVFFPETSRTIAGNGANPTGRLSTPEFGLLKPKTNTHKDPELGGKLRSVPNPFKCLLLVLKKEESLIMGSNGLFYMNYSVLQAALATLFMDTYALNSLEAGLCYLPYGIATIVSSYLVGVVMDRDYRSMAKKAGISIDRKSGDNIQRMPIERARVRSIWFFMAAVLAATLGFGWSVDRRVHRRVPLIMSFICGLANNGIFNNCIVLMVDIHPSEPGLASVSVSLVRCIAAAIGVSAYQPLLNAIGVGWTFTLFAMLLGLTVPMLLAVRLNGFTWRGGDVSRRC